MEKDLRWDEDGNPFYSESESEWTDEEKVKAELVRYLIKKSNPDTDATWIVKQASILLQFIKSK